MLIPVINICALLKSGIWGGRGGSADIFSLCHQQLNCSSGGGANLLTPRLMIKVSSEYGEFFNSRIFIFKNKFF